MLALAIGLIAGCAATGARADDLTVVVQDFDLPALPREVTLSFDQPPPVDGGPAEAPRADVVPLPGDFRKGSRFASVYASTIFGDAGKGEMHAVHVGLGYFFEDFQSVGLDVFGAYVRSGIDDNGVAIGIDLVYRNHFLRNEEESQSIFFEAGLGVQQASTDFSGHRHFNFRTRLGFGATFEIDDRTRVIVGAIYQHISDAGIEGGGGGFDGPMLYAGITFPF